MFARYHYSSDTHESGNREGVSWAATWGGRRQRACQTRQVRTLTGKRLAHQPEASLAWANSGAPGKLSSEAEAEGGVTEPQKALVVGIVLVRSRTGTVRV